MNTVNSVKMDANELTDFLAGQSISIVCARNPDGKLVAHVTAFTSRADGIVLGIDEASKELEDCTKACAIVDEYPDVKHIQGAILRGEIKKVARGLRLEVRHQAGFDFGKLRRPTEEQGK